jgi:hypothetical protein
MTAVDAHAVPLGGIPLAWLALALVISGAQNNRSVQLLATLSPPSTPR